MYPIFQQQQIIHVNGGNGARAFQLMPNSNVLLLDDTAPLVWLAQTDGAGYKTVTPFKIEPYEQPNVTNSIEERLDRLEKLINESYITNANEQKQHNANNGHSEERKPKRNIQPINAD